MSTYTNTHVNHNDVYSINHPIDLPWDTETWDGSLTVISKIANKSLIQELRQHTLALCANFDFTYPNFKNVQDPYLNQIDASSMQQENSLTSGGTGLLDGLFTLGWFSTPVSIKGEPIEKSLLESVASILETKSSYSNYTNIYSYGYGQYSAYVAYAQYTRLVYAQNVYTNAYVNNYPYVNVYINTTGHFNYSRYNEYNRAIHADNDANPAKYNNYSRYNNHANYTNYTYTNVYTNQTAPGYSNGTYNNNVVGYSDLVYANTASPNPAVYQNLLYSNTY